MYILQNIFSLSNFIFQLYPSSTRLRVNLQIPLELVRFAALVAFRSLAGFRVLALHVYHQIALEASAKAALMTGEARLLLALVLQMSVEGPKSLVDLLALTASVLKIGTAEFAALRRAVLDELVRDVAARAVGHLEGGYRVFCSGGILACCIIGILFFLLRNKA